MSNTKHTPGPWKLLKTPNDPDFTHEISGIATVIATVYASDRNSEADARLIAAAPDLLAFAQWFVENRDGPGNAMARAAIAKATGE